MDDAGDLINVGGTSIAGDDSLVGRGKGEPCITYMKFPLHDFNNYIYYGNSTDEGIEMMV